MNLAPMSPRRFVFAGDNSLSWNMRETLPIGISLRPEQVAQLAHCKTAILDRIHISNFALSFLDRVVARLVPVKARVIGE